MNSNTKTIETLRERESLSILELFGGIGACTKALKNIGINVNVVDYVEIDKYACKSYNAINGTNFEPQDITKWDKNINVDLIMHGSPCFLAGTKVLTNNGYKNIEDLKIGDMVLTHKNRFRKVENIGMNKDKPIFSLKAQGSLKTYVTENHPYYVREMKRVWNNKLRRNERQFSEPKWKEVKDLKNSDFVGINIPTKEENVYGLDEETCWLLGRYVADGHIRYNKRKGRKNSYQYGVIYSLGDNKVENFKEHLKKYHASIYSHTQSCHRAVISSMELVNFIILNNFGRKAIEKDIPNFILELPIQLAKSFLDGYMSGDGCFTNNSYKASTISQHLILKLQLLIAKVYKTSSNIYFCKRASKYIIEGRNVNQHDNYSISFNKQIKKQNHSYVDLENNIIWYPITKIENINKKSNVYNITVEEDNSYTANNFIVHNCQDISVSGKQAGAVEGSGTRSSLIYETIRIIKKIKPKYVIWENVKNALVEPHINVVNDYIEKLNVLGYNSKLKLTNSAYYGIPQERERVIIVSILGENNFEFPNEVKKAKNLEEYINFRDEDDLTLNFYNRYKLIKDNKASLEDFVDYINSLPIKKGIGTKRMGLYNFGEMDTITMPTNVTGTLTCRNVQNYNKKYWYNNRLYKPSPKMCWNLMGFSDEDFRKAKEVNNDKHLYNQAGNSIVVNVLEEIFKNLFKGE